MKRHVFYPVILILLCFWLPGNTFAANIITAQSGNWGSGSTWVGGVVPTKYDSVTILSGNTVIVESSGKNCHDLTVESGGFLYTNNSSTGSNPRYLYVYGNIHCDGTIGNGSTYDLIGFNIEGDTCRITGTGSFDASRFRKYLNDFDTTTLVISRPVNLRVGGTALYNNRSGTVFQVIIETGDTLNLVGDGTNPGNLAIDGMNGAASSTGGGSVTVEGILMVSGILYLTTNNTSNPVSVTISPGGIIETAGISCPNSGNAGHTLTIEDGGILNLTSTGWGMIGFTNNSYNFLPGSTVRYSGDSVQVIGNPANYHHLILSGPGTKTLLSSMTFGGNLSIEEGAVLEIEAANSLTVSGNCSLAGTGCLVLKSPADSGVTASFIPEGTVSGSGTAQVERFIKKYQSADDSRYHMLSAPITNQEIQPGFVADPPEQGCDFYRWSEPEGTWINSKDVSGAWNTSFQQGDNRNFIPGRGYLIAFPEDELKAFTGQLITGDVSPIITFTEGDFSGFNLVGNPFSSALTAEVHSWSKSNVDNAVWVWDGEAGNYKSWNGNVGTLTEGIIPAMQGFIVHANGPGPSLTIPASSRVHDAQTYYKTMSSSTLKLHIESGRMNDGIVIQFHEGSTNGFDTLLDVLKYFGAPQAPQLFTMAGESFLSVDVRPYAGTGMKINLGFIAGEEGDYKFTASGMDGFTGGEDIFLEDRLEQKIIKLGSYPSYFFTSAAGYYPDRFQIRFGHPAGEDEGMSNGVIWATTDKNCILLHGLEKEFQPVPVYLFDLEGHALLVGSVDRQHNLIETDLPDGIYILVVYDHPRPLTIKVHLSDKY